MVWGVAITNTSGPLDYYAQLSGSFTLKAPRGGAVTNVTVIGDAGPCTIISCPATMQANVPITCTYTCPAGTKWLVPSCQIGGFQLVGTNTTATYTATAVGAPTRCVNMASDFFKTLLGGVWNNNQQVCSGDALNKFVFQVVAPPPLVTAGQCPTFNSTYPVSRGGARPGEGARPRERRGRRRRSGAWRAGARRARRLTRMRLAAPPRPAPRPLVRWSSSARTTVGSLRLTRSRWTCRAPR
jgi:hypothetical protein